MFRLMIRNGFTASLIAEFDTRNDAIAYARSIGYADRDYFITEA